MAWIAQTKYCKYDFQQRIPVVGLLYILKMFISLKQNRFCQLVYLPYSLFDYFNIRPTHTANFLKFYEGLSSLRFYLSWFNTLKPSGKHMYHLLLTISNSAFCIIGLV
jgi:hypothetical protein